MLANLSRSPLTLQPVTVGQRFDGKELPREFLGSTYESLKRASKSRGMRCKGNGLRYLRFFSLRFAEKLIGLSAKDLGNEPIVPVGFGRPRKVHDPLRLLQ